MDKEKVIGIALGLSENGFITWVDGFGYANKTKGELINPNETLFRWASMSK